MSRRRKKSEATTLKESAKKSLDWSSSYTLIYGLDGAYYDPPSETVSECAEVVARHVLAEMDETLADEEFAVELGMKLNEEASDGGMLNIFYRDHSPYWIDMAFLQCDPVKWKVTLGIELKEREMIQNRITLVNPTRGQVLTALRLFGIPVKRSEQ